MEKFLAILSALLFVPLASAHAGLYHTLVERPLSILPAVALTLAFVLLVYAAEELRKRRRSSGASE